MPNLLTSLGFHDLGFLRILAGLWGLPEPLEDSEAGRLELAAGMLDPIQTAEIVGALPAQGSALLAELCAHGGRLPWTRLDHRHGPLRQMGPSRRARERPHERPASALETLYYRGLVGRAFFDTEDGPMEFGFVPDDLLPLIPVPTPAAGPLPGRPARDDETAVPIPAQDALLDDLATLLAAVRIGDPAAAALEPVREAFCSALLAAAGILTRKGSLDVDRARDFLEAPRGEALAGLVRAWLETGAVDELSLVPEFEIVARDPRDPVRLRAKVLRYLDGLPGRTWWSLPAFAAGIEEIEPEFMRLAGEPDSRYFKIRATGAFLDAAAGWEAIEGAFIRWMLVGPLHWLGLVDLAAGDPPAGSRRAAPAPAAFRRSRWRAALGAGRPPEGFPAEDHPVHVRSDGRISVPRLAPRAARYLIARFCDWEDPVRDEYRYRASPRSLQRAGDQGLKVGQLIALLARHAEGIPPNITNALKSWEQYGRAGRIETVPVLRLPSPEALDALRRSRAARFLGDPLGPQAVALKPGSEARVLAALNELGYLAEIIGGT
ncbi:MAG TPA: helicase-associated domain-containing protein [Anaerolineales bacterium]|nr:helicase-associated domain-containing protein [Anaerolineales bacterium]